MPKAAIVIPARYGSTRFPGKPLAILRGKPLILHVLDGARRASLASDVVVATDDDRIKRVVEDAGGRAVMTSSSHASGTDRVAEASSFLGGEIDIIVNLQGDEPFVRGDEIDDLIRALREDAGAGMATLAAPVMAAPDLVNPDIVKVVLGDDGNALYFSRAPIPFHRDAWKSLDGISDRPLPASIWLRHVGMYAYRRDILIKLSRMPAAPIEEVEKLEQLRALAAGIAIRVLMTDGAPLGIDRPEDLIKAETWPNSYS